MRKINKILQIIFLTANGVALLLLLLSAFSDRATPEFSIFLSYFGLFFPFFVIINLIFLIGWLVVRKWKYALCSVIVFLICGGAIRTYFPLHTKTKTVPSDCIKLLTYNTMRFDQTKPHKKGKPNQVLQYIVDNQADIVCIQEYGSFIDDKNHLNDKDIRKALKAYPYFRVHKINWLYQSQIFGLAIYSKFPILSIKDIPIDSHYNGAFVAELNIKGKKLTLINNHLESNKLNLEERNEYYDLTKEFDSYKLDAFTTKMTNRLTPAFKIRAKQAKMIAKIIKENQNPYLIVCGDFNDTPISYVRHTIKGDLRDAFVDSGSGLGISYNQHRFLFRIDYILHSENIKSYNCTVDKVRYSDHYPVWSYLQLN